MSDSPKPSIRFLRKVGFVAIGSVPPVAIAWWLDNKSRERQEAAQHEMERHEWEKELIDRHEGYSKCMSKLYQFKRAEGEDYGSKFANLLKANDVRATEINECRSQTKDYWRKVRTYCSRFGCEEGNYRVDDWKSQHKRFSAVVPPLDNNMTDYDENDKKYHHWEHIRKPKEQK
jgi:hypothetical protein